MVVKCGAENNLSPPSGQPKAEWETKSKQQTDECLRSSIFSEELRKSRGTGCPDNLRCCQCVWSFKSLFLQLGKCLPGIKTDLAPVTSFPLPGPMTDITN